MLRLLSKILGSVSEEHQDQVRHLPSVRLDQLAEDLLQFESIADLQSWLDQHAAADE